MPQDSIACRRGAVGKTVGDEDSKYRWVVKVGFQKTSLYQKRIGEIEENNNNSYNRVPGAAGRA